MSLVIGHWLLIISCKNGTDTVEMLRQNWAILAIDKEPDAITSLLACPNINTLQLTTQVVSFEKLQLTQQVDLINASFSLPFCSADAFPRLWKFFIL